MNTKAGELRGAERLRRAIALRATADAEEVLAIAELAESHAWRADDAFDVVGEQFVRLGADGTTLVGEFLPLEIAALKGISVTAAGWLIRDVLNLEARHPALWRAVLEGHVAPFRAFQLTQLAAGSELTAAEAQTVDARLASRVGRVAWPRIIRLAKGLIAGLAADRLAAKTEAARKERFVTFGSPQDTLTTEVWARVDSTDAVRLNQTVAKIARELGRRGDSDALEVRRSKALGILANPNQALALLTGRHDARYRPKATVFLHLSEATVAGDGLLGRVEGLGPVTTDSLKALFGTHQITIAPTITTSSQEPVDSYEIPDRIRNAVIIRDQIEVFPFSSRPARRLDLDHTNPWKPGGARQTAAANLGPLSRRVHRAKTLRKWKLEQPEPGHFQWTSPLGYRYRVTPQGTERLNDP